MAGTIVLQKSSSGSGGTTGSGGTGTSTGSGGAVGSGGTTGKGGVTGSGGSTGSGGTLGSGGSVGGGGTTGNGGSRGTAGTTGSGGTGAIMGPCDIYKSGGTACVAAHSTVRALFGAYSGKLYQVRNAAGATKDILPLTPGGFADGGSQDTFCSDTTCVITIVYDQSGKGNDLWYQGSRMVPGSTSSSPSKATSESLTLSGQKVYALYINTGNSYWVRRLEVGHRARQSNPSGMYMVTSGTHFNSGCCFDYGNGEADRKADGNGAMDALNFSAITAWGTGAGSGHWVMADLEYGVIAQNNTSKNQNDPTQTSAYVTAVLKNNGTTESEGGSGAATRRRVASRPTTKAVCREGGAP